MSLIIAIDILAVGWLCATVFRKGFEGALPLAAFLMMLFPVESQIRLPGLFDLTTQRLLVVVLVVLYLTSGRRENDTAEKRPLPLKYLAVLLLAWMLLSSANSVVPDVSFKSTLSQLLDFLVPYYIYAKTVSKVETVNKILFAFVAAMFVCSIFGFLEAYENWSVLSLFPPAAHRFAEVPGEISDRGVRCQATFAVTILFGAALAMAIPLALHLLTVFKARGQRAFLWSAIMLMFLNIYKTGSRGPWLALVLSLVILLLLSRNAVRKYLTVIFLLTATVLIARPGVWETIGNLYLETENPDTAQGSSYQWRYALYGITERELSKDFGRALSGYGPESFYYLGLEGQFQGATWKFESCDSAVVELLMDTGCVGFLLVAALLLKAAGAAFQSFRRLPSPANSLCLVLFVNICAFCFMMTNVMLFGWGQQAYILWILIALVMVYPRLVQAESISGEEVAIGASALGPDLAHASWA
ncbi:MAG TPA: O-antigen ligase family protein [Terriglobales bacterium]